MKRAPRSRQRHDLYAKYHDYDSEISDLLGECGLKGVQPESASPIGGLTTPKTLKQKARRFLRWRRRATQVEG